MQDLGTGLTLLPLSCMWNTNGKLGEGIMANTDWSEAGSRRGGGGEDSSVSMLLYLHSSPLKKRSA